MAGYHSLTQGFVVGEVIRRITGRPVDAFFADEVAGPLGADFHIGLAAEHDHRVAPVIAPPSSPSGDWVTSPPVRSRDSQDTDSQDTGPRSGADPGPGIRVSDGNSLAWRRAQIPSAAGPVSMPISDTSRPRPPSTTSGAPVPRDS